MANPSTADWAALVRLTRYLIMRPRCVYRFPWQDEGGSPPRVCGHGLRSVLAYSALHMRRGVRSGRARH
eukprot:1023245-Alexandrium_andersonii.AAC.1